ncbi:MAG: 16S rRNA (cytosine(1402)-N(4))-methyltransferase RsmH [Burkholderiales bacterium]|nr:16S rRNA (cytosine(1402)-N(4))-methyltransferase RsmH [Burkholderiales bacterium]
MHTGKHVTVLLEEAVEALVTRRAGTYVDCTFGRGGHSALILQRTAADARLIALDRDPQAFAAAQAICDARFRCVHAPFARLGEVLDGLGVGQVDGVLMDLGVSSPQIDDAKRGFSFRLDGPLDMRMDTTTGESAADFLRRAGADEIGEVLKSHGEERFAFQIAQAIVARRAARPLATTAELAGLVADVVGARGRRRDPGQDPATRTFQAIRIHVNQELAQLQAGLKAGFARLAVGGRLVALSFHSLEDRLVKHAMRALARPAEPPMGVPLKADQLPVPAWRLIGRAIRPGAAEVKANPRARSAVMRVIERVAA